MSKHYTLITGASGGIGYELAQNFAKDGHNLILTARSKAAMDELAEKLRKDYGVQVQVFAADLSQATECLNLQTFCEDGGFVIENLVNNAGFGDHEKFLNADWKKLEEMMRLNMESLVRLTHEFLPGMVERKSGGVLNVASTAAFQPGPFMAVYYATKAFVLSFSEALNEELAGTGVHVTSLCPGPTKSGFQKTANMDKAKLFEMLNIPSSAAVAEYGYRAFKKKKAVAIHGLMNKIMVQSLRVSPRFLILKVVRLLQGK
ncbi:SDR family oxidoreductase [Bdellovibrio sp. NC01]|uniref:SDR family NAD(P)-dependent oxidoreductase n=1 Tax=Bdellovibrio sp. NC01 TaxID=2220073 RepID=UPI00115A1413|nr:SDR family oxidoreductase [Bdellovibrio sp. NC01]QDK38024.1 short-chain dehydrogenase [Bdellovibrio sp. NC01]